jgi:hypothetical protein
MHRAFGPVSVDFLFDKACPVDSDRAASTGVSEFRNPDSAKPCRYLLLLPDGSQKNA